MATITASLERSLQNCSLNPTTRTRRANGGPGGSVGRSTPSDSSDHQRHNHRQNHSQNHNNIYDNQDLVTTHSNASSSDDNSTYVELNSHVSLPYHWEQCLDLKTGEIYYINWSTGMKAKQDPRTTATGYNGDYSSGEDDDDEEDEDEESDGYDSEGSSTESPPCSSTRDNLRSSVKKLVGGGSGRHQQQQQQQQELSQDSVLVVTGCKSCLMYYMVPKHVTDCPKCSGQLLHFAANNPPISTYSP